MIMLLYSSFLCFRHYNLSLSQTQKKTQDLEGPESFYILSKTYQ